MDITHEVSKLGKFSPECKATFDQLKGELSPNTLGFRAFCPTCWMVQAKSLQSMQNKYNVLKELWEFVLHGDTQPDVRAHVIGIKPQMESFDYFFSISVADLVLSHG